MKNNINYIIVLKNEYLYNYFIDKQILKSLMKTYKSNKIEKNY